MSDVEPIMIYAEETDDSTSFRSELLQRILTRKITNSEILDMNAGYSSLLRNWILVKKALNLYQVVQNWFSRNEVDKQSKFFVRMRKINKIYQVGQKFELRKIKNAFDNLKEDFSKKKNFSKGLKTMRKVFLNQKLSIEFLTNLQKINHNHSSTSLTAPLQNRSLIVDAVSKEEVVSGLKLLKSVLKTTQRKIKRSWLNIIHEHIQENSEVKKTEQEEDNTSQSTISSEEATKLRNMNLYLLCKNLESKKKRQTWRKWNKFWIMRDDLLTANQSAMRQVMQRALYKFELSWISKKFYKWRYQIDPVSEMAETIEQNLQTEDVEFKPEIETVNICSQTEATKIETCEAQIETDPEAIESCEQIIETDQVVLADQEIQTDLRSEEMDFKTPDDEGKRKIKKDVSQDKLPPTSPRHSKSDFPLQIKRVVNFSKKSDSSVNSQKSEKVVEKPIRPYWSARNRVLCKPEHLQSKSQKPSTSRQEYNNLLHSGMKEDLSKEKADDGVEEIWFSIHGDSSIEESSEEEPESQDSENKKSQRIRIPQFKISKTYDKRSSSHNFRYI